MFLQFLYIHVHLNQGLNKIEVRVDFHRRALNILAQSVTYINTSIRRNATSYHLLPTMSSEDLKLIEKRLPEGIMQGELRERYLHNIQNPDRTQKMTHVFNVNPYNKVIDGCPDCVSQFKA